MARQVVTVEGYRELLQGLRAMKASAAGSNLLKSVMPGALIVRDSARAKAVRSANPKKVGHLADKIMVKTAKRKRTRVDVLVGPSSDHFYGLFLEYGTVKMAARPFLRPALDENSGQVQGVIGSELRSRILEAIR